MSDEPNAPSNQPVEDVTGDKATDAMCARAR